MFGLGAISFLSPWLLLGLLALPILWILLRAVPPAPIRRRFPAVALLLGLTDKETTPDVTPWWLLLIRMLAVAAVILAFAGPILNPQERQVGSGPLLIGMDASWASAADWKKRRDKLREILRDAGQDDRLVAIPRWSNTPRPEAPIVFEAASTHLARLDSLTPNAQGPDYTAWQEALSRMETAPDEIIWVSDGLERDGRDAFLSTLQDIAPVSVMRTGGSVIALSDMSVDGGKLILSAIRADGDAGEAVTVNVMGRDPTGILRNVEQIPLEFADGTNAASAEIDLPTELRNRLQRVEIDGRRSAGAVYLTDDSLQRRKVALLGQEEQEGGALLSGLHFLRKALVPTADVVEVDLDTAFLTNPDVIVFDDIGTVTDEEQERLVEWIESGGSLVRFAGPRLTASGIGQLEEHPLLPVRLRSGGRSVGGTMSWGEPRGLRDFGQDSPFFGLTIPSDVLVNSQVVAQPDPNLADRVLASLDDGTPLVTAKEMGAGRVILFHVTANADWSSLPLSGLFVQMLERLAISARAAERDAAEMEGTVWSIEAELNGFGELRDAPPRGGVAGEDLVDAVASAATPAGIYAYQDQRLALNVVAKDSVLTRATWPADLPQISVETSPETELKPPLLMAALGLMLLDILATLLLGGRLFMRNAGTVAPLLFAAFMLSPQMADADDAPALYAANNTVLAYVITGDAKVDDTSRAGMLGLSSELFRRTAIEPVAPVGVDIELDDISLYPFIYWPIAESQQEPTDAAVTKLNNFLRQGGMIMFDTRDANLAGTGGTPNGRKLQQIAARLDIPRIEPVPSDHVLTRSFYLLQDFPGRYANARVWVEAAPPDAEQIEGIPFRNLNDGVSPVIIGGNDWAAAWAVGENGRYLYPVGRGINGERQREIAYRFGINLLMHVMTGNYKSDQVHVPALLDRLGQ